jgi:3-carboxy-cis,cis-muconate cycloisomerase
MAETAPRLEVDAERMKQNLEVTYGLIYAEAVAMTLAQHMGKAAAHTLVESACASAQKEKRHLRDVIGEDAQVSKHLSASELKGLFDPRRYLGEAEAFVDRAVANNGKKPRRSRGAER